MDFNIWMFIKLDKLKRFQLMFILTSSTLIIHKFEENYQIKKKAHLKIAIPLVDGQR